MPTYYIKSTISREALKKGQDTELFNPEIFRDDTHDGDDYKIIIELLSQVCAMRS